MCEIFPTFHNFLGIIDLKIGIMMIAMLSILTGSIMMSICLQSTKASVSEMMNITTIRTPKQALNNLSKIIRSAIVAMAAVFMIMGVILLLAVLSSQEGFIQIFVWGTFANIVFGFILVLSIVYDCTVKPSCLLSDLDWLTGASALTFSTFYLFAWIYLISVANSLVVLVFSP